MQICVQIFPRKRHTYEAMERADLMTPELLAELRGRRADAVAEITDMLTEKIERLRQVHVDHQLALSRDGWRCKCGEWVCEGTDRYGIFAHDEHVKATIDAIAT